MPSRYEHITVKESGQVLLLTVELARISEYGLAEAMGKELIEAALQHPSPQVVVDMSKLQYMSSVGYGPFISLRARVQEGGGRLVLSCLAPVIKQLFEATRLLINPHSPGSLFEFTDTVPAAVALLSAAR
jgi:anti-anti-sigma factor